ncbi:Beta-barrel assembly machine subunit BamA [Breoghania corrubedonensis]|uniref:Outer membrane protein assembly factor BamA n=1 Tax=Breoghania corrubedonensis TaxID=665038 RepID=A0A2T5VBK9_9HYPH|nr:outer membrane protein assembly factor BamA [Breoghania corrubedonensis]PTW61144.1 Beta-barrel assembly machine subunit BamA [Breoghania corrubedonensis]
MRILNKLFRVSVLTLALLGVVALLPGGVGNLVGSAEAAVARAIVVRGNTRVEDETVRSYVTVKPGRPFGPADIDESIKALFATGLFANVDIAQSGGNLVVTVTENPIINRISFEGNKKLSDEALTGVVQSKSRAVLTRARIQSDVQRILEAYRRSGRFRATVEPKIIDRSNNRADLVFEINEGTKTGVERITFIGNKNFSDGRLRDEIRTRQSGFLSWLRTTDIYDPDRLNADQELLRRFYYKHGYADFRIVSAVADLDREQNVFYVTFTVDEGDKYTFGDVDVVSSLQGVNNDTLSSYVRTHSGDTYNSEEVEKTLEDLTIEAANRGYAFAQVRPRADRNYENHTISISYYIEEGPRVYVERINIRGNDRTREYVIRREFDIAEGDAYNRVLLDKAERRLKNLKYFKDVKITSERGSSPDRVIVNVDVEEQSTGEVSFGIGYSTSDGVIGDVSLTEKNFLGRGQYVRVAVGGGTDKRTYDFNFTEPFFLGRRISLSLEAYQHVYEDNSVRDYTQRQTGGGFGFGLPLRDDELKLNLFYKIYQTKITDLSSDASKVLQDAEGDYLTSLVGYSLVYNTLDDNSNPREGIYAKFQQEFAGVGGDSRYLKTTVEGRYYQELIPDWGVVGMLKGTAGQIQGIGKRLKFTDQFFIGGETIRGFETNGIGPRDMGNSDKEALGGTYYFAATAEATFPFPGVPEEFGLAGAVFADAGSLWGIDDNLKSKADKLVSDDFDLRASVGFGILWKSPFGPLRADFAVPVMKNDSDETQIFRIGGGTRF